MNSNRNKLLGSALAVLLIIGFSMVFNSRAFADINDPFEFPNTSTSPNMHTQEVPQVSLQIL